MCIRRMQAAADKTFGLKNKSKSKVVKQYVSAQLPDIIGMLRARCRLHII